MNETADTSISFTDVQAVVPEGAKEVGLNMKSGDALFFHGKTIHSSYLNMAKNRWRRSFICHYIGEHAKRFEPEMGRRLPDELREDYADG